METADSCLVSVSIPVEYHLDFVLLFNIMKSQIDKVSVSLLNGISSLEGYLIPKPYFRENFVVLFNP